MHKDQLFWEKNLNFYRKNNGFKLEAHLLPLFVLLILCFQKYTIVKRQEKEKMRMPKGRSTLKEQKPQLEGHKGKKIQ